VSFASPERTKESLVDRQTVVFCNPFATQQSTLLTELSSKLLILMVPPHGKINFNKVFIINKLN